MSISGNKRPKLLQGIQIYAGARRLRSGEVTPTGVGRICNWTPDSQGPEADEYPSFGAYQRSLTLVCETGDPGVVTWTPDRNTPDTVYYQVSLWRKDCGSDQTIGRSKYVQK